MLSQGWHALQGAFWRQGCSQGLSLRTCAARCPCAPGAFCSHSLLFRCCIGLLRWCLGVPSLLSELRRGTSMTGALLVTRAGWHMRLAAGKAGRIG